MLKEQFDIAAAETRIRSPQLIEAARAVLVDKERVPAVAKRLGISEGPAIHRAIASIEKKWLEICDRRGWSLVSIALPKRIMEAMLMVQAGEIEDYRKGQDKRKRNKHN